MTLDDLMVVVQVAALLVAAVVLGATALVSEHIRVYIASRGNVAEWCLTRAPADRPVALRGGAFDSDEFEIRVWSRVTSDWGRMNERTGFRCVVPLPSQTD